MMTVPDQAGDVMAVGLKRISDAVPGSQGSDEKRRACYRALFREHIDSNSIHQIREALNQERVPWRSRLKEKIGEMTHRQTVPGKSGRPHVEEENVTCYVSG